MKILIDTGNFKPSENCIIVYKDDKWQVVSRSTFLANQDKVILEQSKKIVELEQEIKDYKAKTSDTINKMAKALKTIIGD